ncbi:hypothetical protein AB0L59_35635 [Streptomyces sp. NPDC052109]|uniref:hypothetical protein n=1 Tax=Streptomyces sp. NPDC052109 TaxID=3155527 RepID=UPI003439A95A
MVGVQYSQHAADKPVEGVCGIRRISPPLGADLLPTPIRGRTVKVPFDDLYAGDLRRHGDELIALCRCAQHPLVREMFDVETLCRAVREARLGMGDAYSWGRMNSSVALVAWLERLIAGP